jgi:subtilisin family serine protease
VRIAVIDSGVQPGHPHIRGERVVAGVAIDGEGLVASGVPAAQDLLGHGTAVTAAIQERAPGATIVPVRIFGHQLRTSPLALVAAIDWAVASGVDLINLSLGSLNMAHRELFARSVQRASLAGVAVIAARSADGSPCLPGVLAQVIGVELDWECPRSGYRHVAGSERVFHAAGYPRPIEGVPLRRNLHGISFAVAAMTGFSARAVQAALPAAARVGALLEALRAGAQPT